MENKIINGYVLPFEEEDRIVEVEDRDLDPVLVSDHFPLLEGRLGLYGGIHRMTSEF